MKQRVREAQKEAEELVRRERADAEADAKQTRAEVEEEVKSEIAEAESEAKEARQWAEELLEEATHALAEARRLADEAAGAARAAAQEAERQAVDDIPASERGNRPARPRRRGVQAGRTAPRSNAPGRARQSARELDASDGLDATRNRSWYSSQPVSALRRERR